MQLQNTINTAIDTYLVTFQNSNQNAIIAHWEDVKEPLKQLNEGYYLAEIYRFNAKKLKFERVPKNKYNLLFGANTEVIEILKKHKIIK